MENSYGLQRDFHILLERAIEVLRSKQFTGRALTKDGCDFEGRAFISAPPVRVHLNPNDH